MIVLYVVLSLGGIFLYAVMDAIRDAITVMKINRAPEPLKDFWHLVKHLGRVGIVLFCVFTTIFCFVYNWDVWTLIFIPIFLIVYLYVLKAKFWEYFFRNQKLRWKYMELENTMQIDLGNKTLNKWCGFHY